MIADALTAVADGWKRVVAEAGDDRVEALRRHSPATYREKIAQTVRECADPVDEGEERTDELRQ